MAVRIFNNIASLNAQRHLGINNLRLAQSIERISSGLRINRAADDVAGLAISEKLRSDIRVLQQGLRNLNDGLSLVNVMEAALNEQTDMIIRMRELAAQAASATIGPSERSLLQLEVNALVAEINRFAAATGANAVLRAIAEGRGPRHALLAVGYAGWAPGQLEGELARKSWVVAPADEKFLFDTEFATKWLRAFERRGFDL